MNLSGSFLALIIVISLSGCYSIEARYSFDSETDFSGLNSYAWLPVEQAIFSTPDSANHYKITMDEMLTAKGFNLNPENPDFLILTQRVETYREMYKSLNGTVEFPKAMLRIDFLNSSSNEVIYEAAADAYYDIDATQKSKNVTIEKAVDVLLSEFPPDE
jgi:hypothetical protein